MPRRKPVDDKSDANIERLLQDEQEAVSRIVSDAVALWASGASEASKAALRQRAEKLSLGGRITARTLTKLRLDNHSASTSFLRRAGSGVINAAAKVLAHFPHEARRAL